MKTKKSTYNKVKMCHKWERAKLIKCPYCRHMLIFVEPFPISSDYICSECDKRFILGTQR